MGRRLARGLGPPGPPREPTAREPGRWRILPGEIIMIDIFRVVV
jgi:hypothetical protein